MPFKGQWWKLKNCRGSDFHTVITQVADGVPTYVVKNECTGKKKVLHHSRLLLWLTNFGEPMWMKRMCTSVTLLGQILENTLSESDDGGPLSELGQVTDHS